MKALARWSVMVSLVAATAAFATPPQARAERPHRLVEADLKFAAEMASQGLWREAMFRWERVLADRPDDARLINNMAVASEALGQFDKARELYAKAAKQDPTRQIVSNYQLFQRAHAAAPPPEQEQQAPAGSKP